VCKWRFGVGGARLHSGSRRNELFAVFDSEIRHLALASCLNVRGLCEVSMAAAAAATAGKCFDGYTIFVA